MNRLFAAAFAIACAYSGAFAQQAQTVVTVRVVDTTGVAVTSADVAVSRGLNEVVASGISDGAGTKRFVIPRGTDVMEVIVRKIGYQRGDHFFRADRDSLSLVVLMRMTPRELPVVQVTAEQSLKEKRFHVTADDIASSKRPIHDGLDVVMKLRPDMVDPPGKGFFDRCGIYNIWVNGKRIVFPPIDPALAIKTAQTRRVGMTTAMTAAKRPPSPSGLALVPVSVSSTLATIHPEHIEEMNYVDCRDSQSTDMARGQNAVFVVLKPGIGFEPGKGSYVLDRIVDDADVQPILPAFRHRLVGIFDEGSGAPVDSAEVVELATGTFARTTATGTVTLGFLPEGTSTVQIRRAGYAELKVEVSISPRDTVPLTLLLTPKPK